MKSDNERAIAWQYTDEHLLVGWRRVYPLVSELFFDLENYQKLYGLVAKTLLHSQILQSLLHHWIQYDRPKIEWPKSFVDQSLPAPFTAPLPSPEGHHRHLNQ